MATTLLVAVRRVEAALVALSGPGQDDDLAHEAYSAARHLAEVLVDWLRTVGLAYFHPNPVPYVTTPGKNVCEKGFHPSTNRTTPT